MISHNPPPLISILVPEELECIWNHYLSFQDDMGISAMVLGLQCLGKEGNTIEVLLKGHSNANGCEYYQVFLCFPDFPLIITQYL